MNTVLEYALNKQKLDKLKEQLELQEEKTNELFKQALVVPFPANVRPATEKDFIKGNIIWYTNKNPHWLIVDQAIHYIDNYLPNAYVAVLTFKQLLISFCKDKQKILDKALNKETKLFNEEDFEDIGSWDEQECKRILNQIIYYLLGLDNINDNNVCPWCLKRGFNRSCNNCSYGKRHGDCMEDDSTYNTICNYETSIVNTLGKDLHELKEKYYELLKYTE